MKHGSFIWCDLSAHRADQSRDFYRDMLGWKFEDQGGYHIAHNGKAPIAGHYQMPGKFIDMRMPAFWMSYIAVDDVAETVELANSMGAKVELGPAEFDGGGQYALIRDPLGAGFTVYQGDALDGATNEYGARAGHGLFVSDASKIQKFYETLFGWSFGQMSNGVQSVSHNGEILFHCHTIPDPSQRGKEEYWAVFFAVGELSTVNERAAKAGGAVVAEADLPEGRGIWVRDPDGGAFVGMESAGATASFPTQAATRPWKAWLGLGLILISSFTPYVWPWAIFLSFWIWAALKDGETYLFERIGRTTHPLTYTAVVGLYGILLLLVLWLTIGELGFEI